MLVSIPALTVLLEVFRPCFTAPSYQNFCLLLAGAVLAQGRRTVTEMLRVTAFLGPQKHFSSYHRFWSRARWSSLRLARVLTRLVVALVPPEAPLLVAGDDTTERRSGAKVYGVGCHRDPVRSTQAVLTYCFGHKWVVLAILVKLPFSSRPWALPILCILYRSKKEDEARHRRHRTLEDLMLLGLWLFRRWVRSREIVFVGDGAYGSVRLENGARRMGIHVVTRMRKDAILYAKAPARRKGQRGRPRKVGRRLSSPEKVVERRSKPWTPQLLEWYGGQLREVRWITGAAYRTTAGQPPVEVRWVLVEDLATGRQECFSSTNVEQTPQQIIELYVLRWYIETTFQETRRHLGLESTRNWVRNSVERTVPCLFGLFSLVTVWYVQHLEGQPSKLEQTSWYTKPEATFTDALAALRRALWAGSIFLKSTPNAQAVEIPRPLLEHICDQLARSA